MWDQAGPHRRVPGTPDHRPGANLDWGPPRWSPDGTELAAAAGTSADCIAYYLGTLDVFVVRPTGRVSVPWPQRPPRSTTRRGHLTESKSPSNGSWMCPSGCSTGHAPWPHGSPTLMGRTRANSMAYWRTISSRHSVPGWNPTGGQHGGADRSPSALPSLLVSADGSPDRVVDPAGFATWQPLAAPLPPAPSFAAASVGSLTPRATTSNSIPGSRRF